MHPAHLPSLMKSATFSAIMMVLALARIHRKTTLGTVLEEARGCSSESGIMVLEQKTAWKQGAPDRCYPRNHPDRIQIAFDDHRLVANAGLILPATLDLRHGLPQLLRKHLDLGGAPGRANTRRQDDDPGGLRPSRRRLHRRRRCAARRRDLSARSKLTNEYLVAQLQTESTMRN